MASWSMSGQTVVVTTRRFQLWTLLLVSSYLFLLSSQRSVSVQAAGLLQRGSPIRRVTLPNPNSRPRNQIFRSNLHDRVLDHTDEPTTPPPAAEKFEGRPRTFAVRRNPTTRNPNDYALRPGSNERPPRRQGYVRNPNQQNERRESCRLFNKTVTIRKRNCETIRMTIGVCGGMCYSSVKVKKRFPYLNQECWSCQPEPGSVTLERAIQRCRDGTRLIRISLPSAKACSCHHCFTQLQLDNPAHRERI